MALHPTAKFYAYSGWKQCSTMYKTYTAMSEDGTTKAMTIDYY